LAVTTEINVGKRRVIEFFLFPIIKYLDEGLKVR
jgi:hemolysin D